MDNRTLEKLVNAEDLPPADQMPTASELALILSAFTEIYGGGETALICAHDAFMAGAVWGYHVRLTGQPPK